MRNTAIMTCAITQLLILATAAFLPLSASARQPKSILAHDFKSEPAEAGWQLLQFDWRPSPAKGGWVSESANPQGHSLSVEDGYWQGPQFAVVPHQYYRLTFQSKAQVPGYWAAMFYDADGQVLPAEHNSGIFQSDDWIDNELYFQGKEDAVSARLWFYPRQPQKDKLICIRNVTLATATDKQVLSWADRLYAMLPSVQYQPPCDRWTLIPRTIQKLQNREAVKIVILGDSIGNDTGNSPLDKLIQRQYPGSPVTVITSVRGGTGCQYYQNKNRVQDYVVRYKPDLVMIIAISHGHQSEPIRNVIRQIREQCDAEILLTTAPIAQDKLIVENYAKDHKITIYEATAIRKAFLGAMEKLAVEERVEFLPLRNLWNEYLAAQQHDVTWFMRDVTHANVRGAQVVARLLQSYFAPK
jgi:lysophospholipase L1-like esterase